jgi:hypothetical protein
VNPHQCTIDNAPRFLKWIRERGGVAVFRSINLSNPTKSWSTPATIKRGDCEQPLQPGEDGDATIPYPKPTWEAAGKPERIITSPDDILVCHDKEVKRFRVAVRRAGVGFNLKLTDKSSAKVRREVEKAGPNGYHAFDYSTQEAIILAPDKTETLTEWAARTGAQ